MDLKKFVLEGNPVCRKEAAIVGDHFRITMLTTALIRFEYSEDGGFEDRATQMVCNRDFPVPEFRVSDGGEELHIYTKDLEIHYDRQKFSPSGLMIRVAGEKPASACGIMVMNRKICWEQPEPWMKQTVRFR